VDTVHYDRLVQENYQLLSLDDKDL